MSSRESFCEKRIRYLIKQVVNFMNAHDMIVVNGIKSVAPFTSIQVAGSTVIDYIITDKIYIIKPASLELGKVSGVL